METNPERVEAGEKDSDYCGVCPECGDPLDYWGNVLFCHCCEAVVESEPNITNPNPDHCFECHDRAIVDWWTIGENRYGFCQNCVGRWPHESREVREIEFLARVASWNTVLAEEAIRAISGYGMTPLNELLGGQE